MRIDSISIDGFGVWHDWRLEPDPGLTVVCGDNEAGKTTLLAFVRSMLFGFESNQYPAVGGGRRGGWLEVTTVDGRQFRIARYHDRGGQGALQVVGEDGLDRGPEYLQRLLHGVEASVYRNVFAFRLDELSEPKAMTEGGAAARIYGAGLGTGAASALAVEQTLKAEASAIFTKGGAKARVNQLLREIEEVERELAGLNLPADYAERRARLADLESRRERLDAELRWITVERRGLERLDAAWEPVQALVADEDELSSDEPSPRPLDGAVERHARLAAAARASEIRVEDLSRRAERLRALLAGLAPDAALLENRSRVEDILATRAAVRAETSALAEARQQHASAERQLAEMLAQLGDEWGEDRLAGLDLTVGARAALAGRFRDRLGAGERAVDQARAELMAADATLAALRGDLEALELRLRGTETETETAPAPSSDRRRLAAAASGLIGAVLALLLLAAGAGLAAAFTAGIGLLAAGAVLLSKRGSTPVGADAGRRAAVAESRAIVADQLERAGRMRDAAGTRLDDATRGLGDVQREWSDWARDHGYDPHLDRETALSLFDAATAARSVARRRDEAAAAIERLDERYRGYVVGALETLSAVGRAISPATVDTDVDALGPALATAVAAEQERARLAAELAEVDEELGAARDRHERDSAAVVELLTECGVATEAELREAVGRAERRRRLEESRARARQSLATLVGHGEGVERLISEVRAVTDIGDVRERIAELRSTAEDLGARRDELLREIGAVQSEIAGLEASAEGSSVRQRHADLVSRLEAEAEHWAVRRLAHGLMERTRQRYEREHRPRVVRTAEDYLREWTDGRWVRIVAPLGAPIEGLERADGRQVPIAALSRGTQEQLYLALRFGLIEHFADEAEPLPIVMDETLVNFDESRADRTARTIERLAERHQILYFTCRPTTPLRSGSIVRLQPPALAGAVGADRPPAIERVPA